MATLHSNGVRAIIVQRLDRLAQELMVQEAAIGDISKHGFTLISVAEPDLMANDPDSCAHAPINGSSRAV